MDKIRFYEINGDYVNYLLPYAPHLFMNKKPEQGHERKYIGILLTVNNMDYFAPLSSFKDKHKKMKENVDFLKIKNYAVINLNNMFPVPKGEYTYIDIDKVRDKRYQALLISEYRYIKSIQEKIFKNAVWVYNHKMQKGTKTPLAKRCNDFLLLEKKCSVYGKIKVQKMVLKNT